ncbi:MAG: histidine phosphatase family protein [Acidimicrobiia bacterium]|nr:histidine phosphatase family protein [Acidimicrobiia bacterium]
MAIHLIRHGHAGKRSGWSGDDVDRPLSAKGRDQAEQLVEVLRGHQVGEVYSSPAVRCVQTVQPLAADRGLEVTNESCLAEGADPSKALRWLLDRATENPVACSHGDLIPVMIRMLVADGMDTDAGGVSHKGSLWTLDVEDGTVRRGTYHPPAR